jgi:hypothetical protein
MRLPTLSALPAPTPTIFLDALHEDAVVERS